MPALPRPAVTTRVLVAAAVAGVLALGSLTDASAVRDDAAAAPCASAGTPQRLATALATRGVRAVRASSGIDRAALDALADDGTGWLDACGRVYVVDPAVPAARRTTADATGGTAAPATPADVFDLSSRPGSDHTLYLDFDGSTYPGTRWGTGSPVVSAPYSIDGDTSTFSQVERDQVFLVWRTVAEDFAPFDVNVTTRPPAPGALTRTSLGDPTYGMPVVITATNTVGSGCSCGGRAYLDVFDAVGAQEYQPAWVFTDGTGTGGYNVAQAASHEAGHSFGLRHDGTQSSSYHTGASGWAPIMGASYSKRLSQWSIGEYLGANNVEDDVATIALAAPVLADDHGGAEAATVVVPGAPVAGTIATRTDTDAFAFTAAGPTTVAVTGPGGVSDLDVRLTVLGPGGTVVATVDPTSATPSDASLDAVWNAVLPDEPARYTAVVDGVGVGDPAVPGGYSDYGSLGAYVVLLTTGGTALPPSPSPPSTPSPAPSPTVTATPTTAPSTPATAARIAFVTARLPLARRGVGYRATIAFSGPVADARIASRLPRGLRWRVRGSTVALRGRPAAATLRRVTVVLTGTDGSILRHRFRLRVR